MAIGTSAFNIGAAMGPSGVPLMAFGAGAAVLSGLIGGGRRGRLADTQGEIAGLQNQIFAEQNRVQRSNLLDRRRALFRESAQRQAGARVAAVASGQSRSSGFAGIKRQIEEQTTLNVGKIDAALASGQRLSGLNQQISTLKAEAAEQSVPGPLESLLS